MKNNLRLLISVSIFTLAGCSQPTAVDPCTQFDDLDGKILNMLEEVNKLHSDDPKFLQAFKMEQVYWIQYRDRRIRTLYPKDWDMHYRKEYGKEVFNPCKCKELARMTQLRIEELQLFIDGGPSDQSECPSSWN